MIKWNVIEEAEQYNVVIEGYDAITTIQPYVNISYINRDKERKGYIVAVSKSRTSEKSFFVLGKSPKVNIVIDKNRVLSTLIKMKGKHKIVYGPTIETLNTEEEFNDEIRILSNKYPRFYFQLDDKIYYNLSFLPKFCNESSKVTGYVLYIPKTYISKVIDHIDVCKYDHNEGYVYPYYLDDQGKLCDYGEGVKVDLTSF